MQGTDSLGVEIGMLMRWSTSDSTSKPDSLLNKWTNGFTPMLIHVLGRFGNNFGRRERSMDSVGLNCCRFGLAEKPALITSRDTSQNTKALRNQRGRRNAVYSACGVVSGRF